MSESAEELEIHIIGYRCVYLLHNFIHYFQKSHSLLEHHRSSRESPPPAETSFWRFWGVFGVFASPKSSRGSLPGASPSACPRPLVTAAGSSSRASAQSQSDTTGHRRQDDVSTRNPAMNCDCCGIEGPLQYRVSSDQCEGWIIVCPSCWPKIRLQEGYRYGGTRKADRRKRTR